MTGNIYTAHSIDGDIPLDIDQLRNPGTNWSDESLITVTDSDGNLCAWIDPRDGSVESSLGFFELLPDIIIRVTGRGPVSVSDDRGTVEGAYLSVTTDDGEPLHPHASDSDMAVIPPEGESPDAWLGPVLDRAPLAVEHDDWMDAMSTVFRADEIRVRRPAPDTGAVEIVDDARRPRSPYQGEAAPRIPAGTHYLPHGAPDRAHTSRTACNIEVWGMHDADTGVQPGGSLVPLVGEPMRATCVGCAAWWADAISS